MFWPKAADTDQFNQDVPGLKSVERGEGFEPLVVQKIIGQFLRVEWIERKAEWVSESYFQFRRENFTVFIFWIIPILWAKAFTARMDIKPIQSHRRYRAQLGYRLGLDRPNLPLRCIGWLLMTVVLFQFRMIYWIYGWQLNSESSPPTYHSLRWGAWKRIREARTILVEQTKQIQPDVWDMILQWIQIHNTLRIKQLSREAGFDWREVFRSCVLMVSQGLLTIEFDSRCESCRGVKDTQNALNAIQPVVPCPPCIARFPLSLHKNLEVVFVPHHGVRKPKVKKQTFCLSSPEHARHIKVEARLGVSGQDAIQALLINLPDGKYRVRVLGTSLEGVIQVSGEIVLGGSNGPTNAPLNASIVIRNDQLQLGNVSFRRYQDLSLINDSDKLQVLVIEEEAWITDMVSALDLIMLKEYRFNFPTERLPWESVVGFAMGSGAVGFCDIKGSTSLWAMSDQVAIATILKSFFNILDRWIERYHGAIIKTTGDGILAFFLRRSDGVRAFLGAMEEVHRTHPEMQTRFGLHHGSPLMCTSVVRQFDLIGSVINFAARLEGKVDLSLGDHIVISRAVFEDDRIRAMKDSGEIRVVAMGQVELKGVPGHHGLFSVFPGKS